MQAGAHTGHIEIQQLARKPAVDEAIEIAQVLHSSETLPQMRRRHRQLSVPTTSLSNAQVAYELSSDPKSYPLLVLASTIQRTEQFMWHNAQGAFRQNSKPNLHKLHAKAESWVISVHLANGAKITGVTI